jgi:predicted Na+-dependent transporter
MYVLAPLLAIFFANLLEPSVAPGFVVSNVVPASSASMGYVLLAEGNIELATAPAFPSILIAPLAPPAIIGFYSSYAATIIPTVINST